MKLTWAFFSVLVIQTAIASGQNYRVETTRLLVVSGDVRSGSCNGGCCEGHDGTACAGVQVRDEKGRLLATAIFDNVPCCVEQCPDRQDCGLPFVGHRGPGESCPGYRGPFSVQVSNLNLCVAPGAIFRVPVRQAKLGNLVNNSWTSGSNCSARDPFDPYPGSDILSFTTWGGFSDTCPDPESADIICVPSDCDPAGAGLPPHAVPRYAAEIIEPYGNEYFPRWGSLDVPLRWRPIGRARLGSYRIVVYGPGGKLVDQQVSCASSECSSVVRFPREAAGYYWWVQPLSATAVGEQSRAGYFNLSPPLTTCTSLGGSCTGYEGPGAGIICPGGGVLVTGALDCPNVCCSGDCSNEDGHDHAGSCGSYDSCGHVFGSPSDPGCGPEVPPDTASCGELGGNYCSTTSSCPWGYAALGTTRQNGAVECETCCQHSLGDGYCQPWVEDCGTSPADCPCWQPGTVCNASGFPGQCVDRCSDPAYHDHSGSCGQLDECGHAIGDPRNCLESCGAMGGEYCSQTGSCPSGFNSLGLSNDCSPCCKQKPAVPQPTPTPTGLSCGQKGGDYCSQNGSCPSGFNSLGNTWDCNPCCKAAPPPPSCGAMGGDYCSQSGSCPAGYQTLGQSNDCNPCCVAQ